MDGWGIGDTIAIVCIILLLGIGIVFNGRSCISDIEDDQTFQKTISVVAVIEEPHYNSFHKKNGHIHYLFDSDDNVWCTYHNDSEDDMNLYTMYKNGAISEEKPYSFDITNAYVNVTGTERDAMLSNVSPD